MKTEELLKIFRLYEMYENDKDKIPFIYHFSNIYSSSDTYIIFYFYQEEISLSITTSAFINSEQSINLTFKIENNNINLIKDMYHKNEIFPHLTFEKNLIIDLEFLSGMIYNFFIPKYKLNFDFYKNNY